MGICFVASALDSLSFALRSITDTNQIVVRDGDPYNSAQVAESHPRFLRRQLLEVVAAMLQFATAEHLEEATRQLAAEFLVVLCEAREKAPGMMRKLPTFSQSIFQIMLNFLLDIEVRAFSVSALRDSAVWHEDGVMCQSVQLLIISTAGTCLYPAKV